MNCLIYRREETTNNGGRGGDNRGHRRSFKRRNGQDNQDRQNRQSSDQRSGDTRSGDQRQNDQNAQQKFQQDLKQDQKNSGNQKNAFERPKWIPPQITSLNLPATECPICGKPIRDIISALHDKTSGKAAHFDCIIARISENEFLEKGDFVSYIGGGRFGIVRMNNPADSKKFTIKKILEWENKDDRPEWRSAISDHFSVT